MTNQVERGAFSATIDEQDRRWAALLVNATWVVIVVGAVLGGILWVAVDGATGEDLGALTWALSFTGAIALFSIRQMSLAERQ